MKYLLITLMVGGLASCNTLIGLGRDTKIGFDWCSQKVQGMGQGGGEDVPPPDNAPIY